MNWETCFSVANASSLASWLALVLLPRSPWLLALLRYGAIGALAVAYAALVMVYFHRAGGGFDTLAAVKRLFASDPVVLAGWLHYLAFDLFVGLWIAANADARGIPRLIQAPILFATFMFGPAGLLAAYLTQLLPQIPTRRTSDGTANGTSLVDAQA